MLSGKREAGWLLTVLVTVAGLFLPACDGNTAVDGNVTGASAAGTGAGIISSGAVDGKETVYSGEVSAMMENYGETLEGIPEDTAAQLCTMVRERREWLENGMDQEGDKELQEYLDAANYGSGLYYAVTDLDRNGSLEIMTSDMEGSGRVSYNEMMEYDREKGKLKDLHYGRDKAEGDVGGYDIGGVEETAVYYSADGTYYYAFQDYVRASSEDFASCSGVLSLQDGYVTEGECYGVAETDGGKTSYYVGDREVDEENYESLLEDRRKGVKEEGTACFGWQQGRGGLVKMADEKLLKKLADSWREFRVDMTKPKK